MSFHSFSSILYPSNDYNYIGNESCIDLQTNDNFLSNINDKPLASSNKKKMTSPTRNREKKREFPPPIPCLAQTQNLASHMSYALKRYYTDEGRLIIKEEKRDGKLILQLVPLGHDDDDDYFMDADKQDEEVEEGEEINNVTMDDDFEEENMGNTPKNVVVNDDDEVVVKNENEIVGGANSKGNYLNCNNSVLSSSASGIFE
ncbi:hypothetical protein RYX36_007043, partial [Vicia faba]